MRGVIFNYCDVLRLLWRLYRRSKVTVHRLLGPASRRGSGKLGSAASRRGSSELLGLVWRYPYLILEIFFLLTLGGRDHYLSLLCIVFGRSSRVGSHLVVILFVDGFPFYVHICGWVPLWTNDVVFM